MGTTSIFRDADVIYHGYPTTQINVTNKSIDEEVGILSDRILVRPIEIYSASIFCKTSDYTLFDGTDGQVTLYLYGYGSVDDVSPIILGSIGKNKNDFPAQDWFRLKLENITIPSGIHYISMYVSLKRNGRVWLSYPCIELGNIATDYEPYETDLSEYYNQNVYEGILETDELIKTENITFNELNDETEGVIRNFYILTADEDGISKYESEENILADKYSEGLDFRRIRLFNRTKSFLPYTFPFLKEKLDELIGENEYSAYIDFNNYTIYLEYSAQDALWNNEITITIQGMKPANMKFKNTPAVTSLINISEEINLNGVTFNYTMDGNWHLGLKPFADLQDKGIIKMAKFSSVQQQLLNDIEDFTTSDVSYVVISNATQSYTIRNFSTKSEGILTYTILPSFGLSEVTNIKVYDAKDRVLTNSTVYVQTADSPLVKHDFSATEG